MTEEFLHYIWKYRLMDHNLVSTSGDHLVVIQPGSQNADAGPDFFNARIRINNTVWAGNVEIHVCSSDWYKHNHQNDPAYDNIVLHVIYMDDKPIVRKNGERIPTLELKGHFKQSLYERYSYFMTNRNWIPCEKLIQGVDRFVLNNWIDRLMIEKLENKAAEITSHFFNNKSDWEQTFYEFLARNFGFKINASPFQLLAKSLPLKVLAKHKDNKFQIEALLFGQAGLLKSTYTDDYPEKLKKEFVFLKKKYNLIPIDSHLWKFLRLRPSNFPSIRISQFADLIYKSSHLFSAILEKRDIKELIELFDVSVSDYWNSHYVFDKVSGKRKKIIGIKTIHLLIINTVIPFLFVYGRYRNDQSMIDRALKLLDQLPGEQNAIISKWEELGLSVRSAFYTQALILLKNSYCKNKRCLHCGIGNEILKSVSS